VLLTTCRVGLADQQRQRLSTRLDGVRLQLRVRRVGARSRVQRVDCALVVAFTQQVLTRVVQALIGSTGQQGAAEYQPSPVPPRATPRPASASQRDQCTHVFPLFPARGTRRWMFRVPTAHYRRSGIDPAYGLPD
jgi:hypothetical protein